VGIKFAESWMMSVRWIPIPKEKRDEYFDLRVKNEL
jgi:hypothetical protein